MIHIPTTDSSIEIALDNPVAFSQLDWYVYYIDPTTPILNREICGTTNDTTSVIIINSTGIPVTTDSRCVSMLMVYNNDAVDATITLSINNSGVYTVLCRVTLSTGDQLQYDWSEGFKVINSDGALKTDLNISGIGFVPVSRNIFTTSPLTGGGDLSSDLTIGIPIATTSADGYLSSADWTTFNNKQNIISLTTTGNSGSSTFLSNVLNIPTYTLAGLGGISLTSLSAISPLAYNNLTGNFSIALATASVSGYLSTTDWNTFNNKGSGTVLSVTGITNRITSTGGANPAIDIDSTYVGQTSLTTLGTITTGIWNASTIPILYGGTGQTTANTAFNALVPSQTSNSGKYLTTDGTNTSWGTISSPVTSVFSRTGAVVAISGDYSTSQVTEVTNLYFTNARAIASTLTGYTSGAGTISATDTILSAIQKLNGNTAALVTGVSSFNTRTGAITLTSSDVTTALTYTPVPNTTTVAGFALSGNITLAALTATDTTLTFSGSYIGATARTIGINLTTANTWSSNTNFSTSVTTPLLIGGSGTTSTLTLQTTTGVGTTGADIIFKGGNNGATELGRFTNAAQLLLSAGSAGTPSLIFGTSGTTTGLYGNASGIIGFASAGGTTFRVSTILQGNAGNSNIIRILSGAGSVTTPNYSFNGSNTGTGVYSSTVNELGLATNGANALYINSSQAVGIGQTSPDASSLLDIVSTTKGVLFPRMTTTQKNAITSPLEGLIVYDSTLHKLCVRTASTWETITSS